MPCFVKECGRRGATGASATIAFSARFGTWNFLRDLVMPACAGITSCSAEKNGWRGKPAHDGVFGRALTPYTLRARDCQTLAPAPGGFRLVAGGVVCLRVSAPPDRNYAFQFIFVHFRLSAGR